MARPFVLAWLILTGALAGERSVGAQATGAPLSPSGEPPHRLDVHLRERVAQAAPTSQPEFVGALGRPAEARTVSFRFVGDVIFGRYKEDGYHRRPRDASHAFDRVRDVLTADFTLANLETPLVRNLPVAAPVAGALVFGAEAGVAPVLRAAGINAVSLANNHAGDQRADGLQLTPEILEASDIRVFGGAGEDLHVRTVEVRGLAVGVVALTTLLNFELPKSYPAVPFVPLPRVAERVGPLLAAARASHDLLVVAVHWGNKYENRPTPLQRALAAKLIEAGADVIAGHHPHVLQPVELLDGAVVAYSLGNFLFDAAQPAARVSGILKLDVEVPTCEARIGMLPIEIALLPSLHPRRAQGRPAMLARGQVRRGTRVAWRQEEEELVSELSLRHCRPVAAPARP